MDVNFRCLRLWNSEGVYYSFAPDILEHSVWAVTPLNENDYFFKKFWCTSPDKASTMMKNSTVGLTDKYDSDEQRPTSSSDFLSSNSSSQLHPGLLYFCCFLLCPNQEYSTAVTSIQQVAPSRASCIVSNIILVLSDCHCIVGTNICLCTIRTSISCDHKQ